MVNIGKRIKAARQKAGMSQEELAQVIGSTKSAVSRYEAGKRQPSYDQLQRIAKALSVSIYELFDGSTVDESGALHVWPADNAITLLDALQDGKPLLLSPDELAKLKSTPKEQVAAALDEVGQEEQKHIVRISAPLYKLRGVSPEQRERLKELKDQAVRYEHSLGITGLGKSTMINALLAKDSQRRIATALGKLNEEGQEKAAERVEELTEIPRYQAQEPPTAPAQDTTAPQEGIDTTPPSEALQEPPEGHIQSITMLCPICGQHLRGDTSTGKAYCNYCKRSFPLPQISK